MRSPSPKNIIDHGFSSQYPNRKWIARKPTKKDLLKYKSYKIYTNKLEQKTADLSLSGIFEYRGKSYPMYDNNDILVINNEHIFWKENRYVPVDGDYFAYQIDNFLGETEIINKGVKAFKYITKNYLIKDIEKDKEAFDIIEKELNALHILERRIVYTSDCAYLDVTFGGIEFTEEELKILRDSGVLRDEKE